MRLTTACDRLGFARDELLSMGVKQLDAPEIAAGFDGAIQTFVQKGSMVAESCHVRKDGARIVGVAINDVRLVAAHAWDAAGALRAGCAAAFVARPGMALDPLAPKPDVVGKDLREVAERIIQVELAR